MPEPITTTAVSYFVAGASMELGRQVAAEHGPAVRKSIENSVKQVDKAISEAVKSDPLKFGSRA